MKLYFLPSHCQRKLRNGLRQPHRLFLADGTEIKGLARIELEMDYAMQSLEYSGIERGPVGKREMGLKRLILTIERPNVVSVSRRPKKTAKP